MRKTWALVSFVPAPERERLKRQMSADGAGLKSAVRENEAWSPGATDTRSAPAGLEMLLFELLTARLLQVGTAATSMDRSEEHTSELQSRFGISYAVFCLKKK